MKPEQRERFDADVNKMTIINAISTTTIPALQKGETVECIYVVEVNLKRPEYDQKNIIFALKYDGKMQLAVFHCKLITGVWAGTNDYEIELKGLNLDKIWESLIKDIGNITIEEGNTLEEQIAENEGKAKFAADIEHLERKARAEKQPRKRLELFEQLKQLNNERILVHNNESHLQASR